MHTYRVEGAHSRLKDYLTSSQGNLSTFFDQYNDSIVNQVREVKGSLNESMQRQQTLILGADVFRNLHCKVSYTALRRIIDEYEKGTRRDHDQVCRCMTRKRDGLPCVHDLAVNVTSSIPIKVEQLHVFWRTLRLSEVDENPEEEGFRKKVNRSLLDEFAANEFPLMNVDDQLKCVAALSKVAHPERTSLKEPAHAKHRGRPAGAINKRIPSSWEYAEQQKETTPPKKQRGTRPFVPRPEPTSSIRDPSVYFSVIPEPFHAHLHGWFEIASDGNCGYRAIAEALGLTQRSWIWVRRTMMQKLSEEYELLKNTILAPATVETILEKLNWEEVPAPEKYWMSMPSMGVLTASAFNCALVVLDELGSTTYLPIRAAPDHVEGQKIRTICICFLRSERHFITVRD